jgi:hypothetical protein
MASIRYYDRIKETSTTTGTGNFTLDGASSGFNTFSSAHSVNDYVFYTIINQKDWTEREQGLGKLTGSTTLQRLMPKSPFSSSAVNFSAGTKIVYIASGSSYINMASEFFIFGSSGVDGDVTISAGTTTLTRDMYYNTLTISGTGVLNNAGYRIFVYEYLDLRNAPNGAIITTSSTTSTVGGAGGGASGVSGTTGAGTAANTASTVSPGNGGTGGAGGTGGTGSGGAGASGGSGVAPTSALDIRYYTNFLMRPTSQSAMSLLFGGNGGSSGGGAGGGGGGQTSGASGAGGSGGAVLFIAARVILRGASTASGCIRAFGTTAASNGSNAVGTNSGGGAGGGGGGGGWVYIAYAHLGGSTATNAIDVSGQNGGAGGNGTGTGTGGYGGQGGGGGRYTLLNVVTGAVTTAVGTTGSAGGSPSGTTGGSAGTGESFFANL